MQRVYLGLSVIAPCIQVWLSRVHAGPPVVDEVRWRYEDWSASLAANYTSKYRDEVDLLSQQDIDTLAAQGLRGSQCIANFQCQPAL